MHEQEFDYEPIRAAILRRAVIDYSVALKKKNLAKIAALEKFFRGAWGQFLSNGNGDYIIDKTRKMVKEGKKFLTKSVDL